MVKRLLFWAALIVWSVLLVEATMAAYFLLGLSRTYYRPLYLEERNDSLLWRTEHHDWGAWHKPSATARHTQNCFSVTYRSNSYGARDKERSTAAAGGRAIMLGDSFVEGYAIDENKRLSNLLEARLEREILNFGAGGHFGPLQYQLLYQRLARQFEHDLVIVGFLPTNDFTDNDPGFFSRHRYFPRRYRPYYSQDGGHFYPRPRPDPSEAPIFAEQANDLPERRSLKENFRRLFWLYGLYREIRFNVSVLEEPTPSDYVGYLERDPLRISRALESILEIHRAAIPRKVLVFFIPDFVSWSHVEKHPASYEDTAVRRMQAFLESRGVATVDLLNEFMRKKLKKESLFLSCDGHWSTVGNQEAAAVLSSVVREMLSAPRPGRSSGR